LTTFLLDTHVVLWMTIAPEELSSPAREAIATATGIAVASVTWWEMAWLAHHGRVEFPKPVRSFMEEISEGIQTLPTTPAIGDTAVLLGDRFPGDPTDRIIYATAIEEGLQLVTKDQRMRNHPYPRQITIW
jgi:PIN domain nuclease of toxin-antitoxin system